MRYGSIRWSVSAQATKDKRIISCIGDGSFQNWNYTALVDVIHNGEGKCWTTKVHCEEDLVEAIEKAKGGKKIVFASLK
ncbi:hypothetical protein AgCh_034266 [Apium graveolens]